ncbi:cyclase family protein [Caldiplasma sukawensis]
MINFREIIDISMPVDDTTPVYEGDPQISIKGIRNKEKNYIHITDLHFGNHTGTHFDAPFHMIPEGKKSSEIPLDHFIGNATVIQVNGDSVKVENIPEKHNEIVLFKTKNSDFSGQFHRDFAYIEKEAAKKLASHNVKLVGIDYLSVDPFGFDYPHAHMEFLPRGIVIVEGLSLKNVTPGDYYFIGLPLKISTDGAPIRAILLKS